MRHSKSYEFTYIPGSKSSEERLAELKRQVKFHNKHRTDKIYVVLKGRLGRNNKYAHLYSVKTPITERACKSYNTHQNIMAEHAAHFDVYVYDR